MALPTAAAIRSLALPQITGTLEDSRLDSLIATANAVLAQYCLWPRPDSGAPTFEAATYTVYRDGPDFDDPRRLTIGLRPVSAVASVENDSTGLWTYSEDAVVGTDVVLDTARGALYAHPATSWRWAVGLRAVRVVCTAGYNVGAEPPLTQAIGLLIAHWSALRTTSTLPAVASAGGQSATYRGDDLPASVRQLVAPYERWESETEWRHG
jgi:hypothetical protein